MVRIVERWVGTGEPTRPALLAQARAFLNLMLMDRAWVRLKEVSERWSGDRAARLLTAEVFIERGWPGRARRLLEPLAEDPTAEVAELLVLASQPPRQPAPNAREVQESGTPQERLQLAERFMATGSFLRAKSILERLRRQPGLWSERVDDLLWGVDGEFAKEEGDPAELARAMAPELAVMDLDPDHRSESGKSDPGESWSDVTATGIVKQEEHVEEAFPALFRRVDELRVAYTTEEVTSISRLATTQDLQHRDETEEAEFSDPMVDTGSSGPAADTQILMVIPKQADGPVHTLKEETDELRDTLNLRDYLSDMGMGVSDLGSDADEVELEEEDEDLVIVTRRETGPREPTEEVTLSKPIEVVEPDLAPPPLKPLPPSGLAMATFDPVTIGEPAPPTRPRVLPPLPPDEESEELRPIGGYNARPRFAVLLLVLLTLAVLTVNLGLQLAEGLAGARVAEQTHSVVASGDYEQLLAEEAALEGRFKAGDSPHSHLAASYALVELILWAEYTGDVGRLENAIEALASAREDGGAARIRDLATGVRAYHQGDPELALGSIEGLDGAEASLIRARVALDRGDFVAARGHAQQAVSLSPMARYHYGLAEVCHAVGDNACAKDSLGTALEQSPSDPRAQLLQLLVEAEELGPKERVRAMRPFLEGAADLPPRVAGLAWLAQAANQGRLGRREAESRALDKAVTLDPGNPVLQYWVAAGHLEEGRGLRAYAVSRRILRARPHDVMVVRAHIEVLLTLDRMEEARSSLSGSGPLIEAAVLLAEGKPEEAARLAQAALSVNSDDAMAAWLLGQAYGELGRPVDAQPLLLKASEQFAESEDPYERLLAGRAFVASVFYGYKGQAERALQVDVEDGESMSLLARYHDATGEDELAAECHERAAELSPESGRVQYQRGLFYTDQDEGLQHQHVAWDAYLDLEPTGTRERKVRERMGRR